MKQKEGWMDFTSILDPIESFSQFSSFNPDDSRELGVLKIPFLFLKQN